MNPMNYLRITILCLTLLIINIFLPKNYQVPVGVLLTTIAFVSLTVWLFLINYNFWIR